MHRWIDLTLEELTQLAHTLSTILDGKVNFAIIGGATYSL